jgi:hypothetical protein
LSPILMWPGMPGHLQFADVLGRVQHERTQLLLADETIVAVDDDFRAHWSHNSSVDLRLREAQDLAQRPSKARRSW